MFGNESMATTQQCDHMNSSERSCVNGLSLIMSLAKGAMTLSVGLQCIEQYIELTLINDVFFMQYQRF